MDRGTGWRIGRWLGLGGTDAGAAVEGRAGFHDRLTLLGECCRSPMDSTLEENPRRGYPARRTARSNTGPSVAYLLFLGFWLVAMAVFPIGAHATTVEEVTKDLMSPFCPGRLLVDCPTEEGRQLRILINQKLGAGESKEEIIAYLVDRYGEKILAAPARKGFGWSAWIFPFIFLAVGAVVAVLLIKIWGLKTAAETPPEEESPEKLPELDRVEEELRNYPD